MNTLLIYIEFGPLSVILTKQRIIDYLRVTGTWAKLSENIWLIKSTRSAIGVRDDLRGIIAVSSSSDKIFVVNITNDLWASLNLSAETSNWLKENI